MTPQEIKARLKKKKLSQSDLAERYGVSGTTISFLVNRKATMSEKLEKRFARTLGVTLEELRAKPVQQDAQAAS